MKTQPIRGDILQASRGIIVHGCNCLGVMGANLALQVKQQYPNVYKAYMRKKVEDGLILGSTIPVCVNEYDKWIVNAMTQRSTGPGLQVSYDAIHRCFERVVEFQQWRKQTQGDDLPILYPKIGAGIGNGDFSIIESIIDSTIPEDITHTLYVFE